VSAFHRALAAAIGRASGAPFAVHSTRTERGGDISQAFTLGDGPRTFFVKTQPADRLAMFEAEAAGLAELAAANAVRAPQALCHGIADGQAYLVLESLPLRPHGDAAQLGRQLAQLHRMPCDSSRAGRFGWTHDNWIGSTPQPNAWQHDWIAFWRDQRLGFQLRLAAQNGYGGALQSDGEKLLAHLDAFFGGYRPQPSLLHGDLWGGNHGYLADATPVIFDPAVYFGDRECDLAMSELFGGFAPDFYAAYREAWPLDAGYAGRKTLYNLYHILNHANLFGGGYAAQAARMAAQLLAQIR
jgi:fructosamine-3-kinase